MLVIDIHSAPPGFGIIELDGSESTALFFPIKFHGKVPEHLADRLKEFLRRASKPYDDLVVIYRKKAIFCKAAIEREL